MASKKKAPAKRTAKKPDLSNRPLVLGDLPKTEQRDAESLVSRISETMPQQFDVLVNRLRNATVPTQVNARERYEKASPQAVSKPITIESMAKNRSDSFMRGLSGPHRLPHEDYAGQEFYFQHRGEIDTIRQEANAPDIGLDRVLGATARLSVRTKPEAEKSSAKGLLEAHARGSVDFNPTMIESLATSGVSVPEEFHGKKVPFSETPSHIVKAMVDPDVRGKVKPHLENVNLDEISKTSMATNVEQAHKAMQGHGLPSPTVNPKQFSYQRAHDIAVPNSPEHGEYQLRAMNLGQVARGEQSPNQGMFDFYGLRDNNEGVLSNETPMPEDSWMNAVSYDQPSPIKKAAGDVTLGSKKGTTKRGRKLSVGAGNKDVSPLGIQHAVNTEATSRAAKDVQKTLGVDYTVPSMMVQEGVWAETRREAGGDASYNAVRKESSEKKTKKPKSQPTLF
jgi:hypothetical protein